MARGNRINTKAVMQKIAKSPKFQKKLSEGFDKNFQKIKQRTLIDFETHPVTMEIAAGPTASNSSGALGGYGNLFSFIGFNRASNPLSELRKVLSSRMSYRSRKTPTMRKNKIEYKYVVRAPEMALIYAATPMPWESGSWVEGIEEGMSNFGFYMYKRFSEGKSGMGLQADWELRRAIFTPKKYISEILEKFQTHVKTIKQV